ncbi:MAG: helix-turn-helix transcriptional regulator [Streptomyces turgidiscabies]|nr:helix-turn-helix transcriptional regulator [Streptomyces turgidiscabies]
MVSGNGEPIDCLITCVSVSSGVHLQCTGCTAAAAIFRDTVTETPTRLFPAPVALTEVPVNIIEGLASGLSTQQLASRLGLSSRGVEYHISSMLRVLKAPNRSALVARAYALGILSPHFWPPRVRSPYLTGVTGPLLTDDVSLGEGHAGPLPAETVDTPTPHGVAAPESGSGAG